MNETSPSPTAPESLHEESEQIKLARTIVTQTGVNLFLTGKAGTGKTTFLRSLCKELKKRYVVLAPTGVAAINAGGATLHSFFQLDFSPFVPGRGYVSGESFSRFRKSKIRMLRTLDLIIIDEISMVRPDVLDAIDSLMRRFRNPARPFGGAQLLLIGDLRQLAPVVQESEWQILSQHYASPYFFESHALREARFMMVELTKVFRQSDPVFLDILNKIRDNRADADTLAKLNRRADRSLFPLSDEGYIRLTSHNFLADKINNQRLDELTTTPALFEASVNGKFPESSYPAEKLLKLKRGAQVIFIKNDPSGNHEYYNGLIGEVTELSDNKIKVRPRDSELAEITVGRVQWENKSYSMNDEGDFIENVEGTFEQVPLRLAWAITIHKSQGLTFDRAIVDASRSFAPGQTYVALSRCRTLEGLLLESPLPLSAIMTDQVVNNFISSQPRATGEDDAQIQQFKESYLAEMLFEMFDFRAISNSFESYSRNSAAALGSIFPHFIEDVSRMQMMIHTEVMNVAAKMWNFLAAYLPRRADKAIAEKIHAKISGGAGYFVSKLESIHNILSNTPKEVDNKTLRKRLQTACDDAIDQVAMKIMTLQPFMEEEFSPESYMKHKTQAVLSLNSTQGASKLPKSFSRRAAATDKNSGRIAGATSSGAQSSTGGISDIQNEPLFRRLSDWRKRKAQELRLPPYTIFSNRTLMAISAALPLSLRELKSVKGVGPKVMERYGEEVVRMTTEYAAEVK